VGYCLTGLGGASRVAGDLRASLGYYRQANRSFTALKDTFGKAYSYCGIANALRMKGDFSGALKNFKMAKTNYRRIGDKVSYAYTLWGEGTAYQLLGKDAPAHKDFIEAERLFRDTKDKRGLVYCMMSLGELEFRKDPKKGMRMLKKALKRAEALGIGVETGYARRLLRTAEKTPDKLPLNLA